MADSADIASEQEEIYLNAAITAARGEVVPYTTGPCKTCGAVSERLLRNTCVACRELEEIKQERAYGHRR